ncbi:MAG: hypothetical protein M1815_005633 [Lichina confinis]|nr:MAG: hypothetical protein M1815_005633 [Lichina confinis]
MSRLVSAVTTALGASPRDLDGGSTTKPDEMRPRQTALACHETTSSGAARSPRLPCALVFGYSTLSFEASLLGTADLQSERASCVDAGTLGRTLNNQHRGPTSRVSDSVVRPQQLVSHLRLAV